MRLLRRRRRGMTLVEAGVALVVVAAAGLALVQLVALAARQQRAAEIRLLAVQEVANQAERVALRNWDEAAVGQATSWEPGPELAERARRPACRMTVTEEAGPPPARRILLQVDWLDAAGQRVSPVELTVWKFRREATP
jgi:type II secretory pathway pseudopilin PulG